MLNHSCYVVVRENWLLVPSHISGLPGRVVVDIANLLSLGVISYIRGVTQILIVILAMRT